MRTGGTGQLDILHVPPYAYQPRACRAYHVPWRHRPRLQLGTTTQLRLGRDERKTWGVTDPRVSRLHARICAGPGPPTVTAEGANPCVLVKALTGAQHLP